MTLLELKYTLDLLSEEYDECEVIFGESYPNFPVETIQVIFDQVVIGM